MLVVSRGAYCKIAADEQQWNPNPPAHMARLIPWNRNGIPMLVNLEEAVRGASTDLHRDLEAVRALVGEGDLVPLIRKLQTEAAAEGVLLSVDGVVKPVYAADKRVKEIGTLEYLHIRLKRISPEAYSRLMLTYKSGA